MSVPTVNSLRRYQQVAAAIERAVAEGQYQPGQRLASERDLAEQFRVSRPTVRRAVIALEMRGLLEARQDGRSVTGRKIGLTSRAMQQASQITEPDYAPLMDDMFFESGSDIPIERFIAPRVVDTSLLVKATTNLVAQFKGPAPADPSERRIRNHALKPMLDAREAPGWAD